MHRTGMTIVVGSLLWVSFLLAQEEAQQKARELYQQAMRFHRQNAFGRVVELCKQAVKLDPNFTEAHRELIDHVQNRDSLRAAYQRLAEKEPNNPVFQYLLGKLAKSPEDKAAYYRKAYALDSTYTWANVAMGYLHLTNKEPDKALQYYAKSVEYDPRNKTGYRGMARAYDRMGQPEKAIEVFQQFVQNAPDDPESYFLLARAYNELEQKEKAIALYRQVYEKFREGDPDISAEALYWMARTEPDITKAIAMYEQLVRDYPNSSMTASGYNHILEYYRSRDWKKTVRLAQQAMHLADSLSKPFLKSIAYQNLIRLYQDRQDDRALSALADDLIGSGHPDPFVYYFLTNALSKTPERLDLAENVARRGLDIIDPEKFLGVLAFGNYSQKELQRLADEVRGTMLMGLAKVLLKKQAFEEAISALEEGIKLNKREKERSILMLGRAYLGAGDLARAIDHLMTALIGHRKDEAAEDLKKAYKKRHGRLNDLPKAILDFAHRDTSAASAPLPVPAELTLEQAILQARSILSGEALEFEVTTLTGKRFALKEQRGKVVLLDFWATWCGPCIAEMPHLQKLYEKYQDEPDVVFLAISIDEGRNVVERFIEKNKYTLPVAHAPEIRKKYGVRGIPTLILIGRDGRIHYRTVGFNVESDFVAEQSEKIELLRQKRPLARK
ncbi:MAG: tetratricopeptide repeat protein [candidate division KSB1 bacterium]|nr:tetratricopeptide repeat protein [candidate division KSB1 bacterium]